MGKMRIKVIFNPASSCPRSIPAFDNLHFSENGSIFLLSKENQNRKSEKKISSPAMWVLEPFFPKQLRPVCFYLTSDPLHVSRIWNINRFHSPQDVFFIPRVHFVEELNSLTVAFAKLFTKTNLKSLTWGQAR